MIEQLKQSQAFNSFLERVQDRLDDYKSMLETVGDINKIYKSQGAVEFGRFIIELVDVMIEEERMEAESKIED